MIFYQGFSVDCYHYYAFVRPFSAENGVNTDPGIAPCNNRQLQYNLSAASLAATILVAGWEVG
jgi:hypothetical protein